MAIVLSVLLRFTTSGYPFGILWPVYCLSFLDLRVLITLMVSCGHCIVCPSSINDFWLPLWYHVVIVLSVLPRFTISDYPFGVLWPLYCLSLLDLRLLITPLVSFGHCIVCPSSIYDFWLSLLVSCGHCIVCHSSILYCLSFLDFVLSVIPRFTTSDYPFGILWPLYCLSFLDFVLSIIPRFCIICHSSIYDFWLPLWYLVAIALSVHPRFTTSDYSFGILWPLYCLSFLDLRLLITLLVSCGHCIVCPSSIYDFWLSLLYLVAIVLSFPPRLSVVPRLTTSDYPFGILWPLYFLSFLDLRLLITPLVSCGHCAVCPSSIYDLWLSFSYLLAIVLSVLPRFTTSDYSFGIMWPFYCLSFLELRLLITPLVSCGHCIVCRSWIYDLWLPIWYLVAIVLSVLLRFTTSGYPFGILWPVYCLSFLDFVLSVISRFTTSDYPFGILWPLRCLSFLDLRLMIILFVSCGHCIVCPSSIYDFWLLLWYHVAILLSVLPRVTTSDYPFGILWPLHCLSFLDLRLLITPLVSCGHCIVCRSWIYDLWLSLLYLVAIVLSFPPRLSVLPRLTTSDYPFGILWPLYFLSFLDLRLLINPLVSCGHCIVCHSLILYCPSFLDLRLLITPLVSCGHCAVCPSSIYDFW